MSRNKKPFQILKFNDSDTNSLGQPIYDWETSETVLGYMDMLSGSEDISANAYLEDSTHVFITWDIIDIDINDRIYNERKEQTYEVTYVDEPMELGSHLEVFCKVQSS